MNRKQRRAAAKTPPRQTPDSPPAAFAEAMEHHRAGRLAEAEAEYLAALDQAPDHAPTLHYLGLIALARRDGPTAVARIGRAVALRDDDVEARINLAIALRQCGRIAEAVAAGRAAQALEPNRPEIRNNLGIALRELGQLDEAEAECRAAIALRPDYAEAYNNLGNVLADRGRLEEAIAVYQTALSFRADLAEAHNNLGGTLNSLGRHAEAVIECSKALEIRKDYPEAINNMGNALAGQKRIELAADAFRLALALRPSYPEGHNNLGIALKDLGRLEEAEAECRAALALRPAYPEAHNNLGIVLKDLGRLEEAEAEGRAALALRPHYPEAWSNLGNALTDLGRMDEAIVCYRKALEQRPNYPEALNNLGNTLKAVGRMAESIAACRAAIDLRPDYAEAHSNLAFSLLLDGAFLEGWREYEWRWRSFGSKLGRRAFPQPEWRGEPLEGKTLLLHPEQGFGDLLQFCRYALLAAERGGRILLESYRPLTRLLATLPGPVAVVATGDPLPPFDYHLPLMSMPHRLGTTLATIPAPGPYLFADPAAAEEWGRRLGDLPGLKVGLVWAGDPRPHDPKANAIDRRRSIDPARLLPLLTVPGATVVSLQMGPGASRIATVPEQLRPRDVMAGVTDFADTAAIVANLDLVVTVDTSMVHLAGALGKPVWVLSRYDGCWRWLLDRDDSPWYPTLRLYRQPAPDAWEDVVLRVATDLAALARRG